jgi:L-threonylcarbamoyladenylate synthase
VPTVSVASAAELLARGEVVAFPTETVYGLGAAARQPFALRKVFALKGRPADHPLIVHLAPDAPLEEWAVVNEQARALAAAFWPGPLSLVLPRTSAVLDEVTGGLPTVCVRRPSHPLAQELLRAFGSAIAAPSANRFGRVSATEAAHVRVELGEEIAVVDGGPATVGIESTIVDVSGSTPALLRPGAISRRRVEAIVGPLGSSAVRAPGGLDRHYAPRTGLVVAADPDAEAARRAGQRVAILRARAGADYARALYAELRRLDALGVDVLIAERSADLELGEAINDRLARAERGSGGAGEEPSR